MSNNFFLSESFTSLHAMIYTVSFSSRDWACASNACRFSRLPDKSLSDNYAVLGLPVLVRSVLGLQRTGQPIANCSPKHSANGQKPKKLHRISYYSFLFIVTVVIIIEFHWQDQKDTWNLQNTLLHSTISLVAFSLRKWFSSGSVTVLVLTTILYVCDTLEVHGMPSISHL